MVYIKNSDQLNKTPERKVVLDLIEAALASIQPERVMNESFVFSGNTLKIQDQEFNLDSFERIFLIGFGKGSAGISKRIETSLGEKLTEGHVIDLPANAAHQALQAGTNQETISKVRYTSGSHPLPSTLNLAFTQALLKRLATLQLTEKDLVLVIVCGGGSSLLVAPHALPIEKQIEVGKALLKSGADIIEMNIVRQHLSDVKGGGLAKALYPARVASLIFSDVPGNDLTYIASGPTVKAAKTIEDAKEILKKYNLEEELSLPEHAFVENPQEDIYFQNVSNIIMLSNKTALSAMQEKAQELGIETTVLSDKFQSDAKIAGAELINQTKPNSVLLAGGETTVHVTGGGAGGRNQEVVLGALAAIDDRTIMCSFDSDGWDNSKFAGAIGDMHTKNKATELHLDINQHLTDNSSLEFFEKIGDGIDTGRLPSNVSDLFIVYRF